MPRSVLAASIFAVSLAGVSAAQSPEPMAGEAISGVVSGNTVEGAMLATGPYAEFYDADGTIRGDGYTGTWSVEGDAMCFEYGEGPDCYGVGQAGDEILWIKDGEVSGTGRLVDGNPNNF